MATGSQPPSGEKVPEMERSTYAELETVEFTRMEDLPARAVEERWNSWINGITMISADQMVLVDYSNSSVKLVDIQRNKVTSYFDLDKLPAKAARGGWMDVRPWHVCTISRFRVAVTLLHSETVQIMLTRGGLSPGRYFGVGGKCFGITYQDNKLAVCIDSPPRIEIMDTHGRKLQCLEASVNGERLFGFPNFMRFSFDGNQEVLFVSDTGSKSVVKVSLDGRVMYRHKLSGKDRIRDISTFPDGRVLAAYFEDDAICMLTKEGDRKLRVLDNRHEIDRPTAICDDPLSGRLFLGSLGSKREVIMCFKYR